MTYRLSIIYMGIAVIILTWMLNLNPSHVHAQAPYVQNDLFHMRDQYKGEHKKQILAQTLVSYFNDKQRRLHKLYIHKGLLVDYKGDLLDPDLSNHPNRLGKAIYVMDQQGNIYFSFDHHLPHIYHSSFLQGKAVAAAGEMMVHEGVLYSISNASGHYRPRAIVIKRILKQLTKLGANLNQTEIFMFDKRGQFKHVTDHKLDQNIEYESMTKSISKSLDK